MPSLTSSQRDRVLELIYQAIAIECPKCFAADVREHAGGVNMVARNLDGLVDIVRRSTAQRIEPFLVQIMWDICSDCPYQFPSGYCALRQARLCVMYVHAPAVVETVTRALLELNDPQYMETHPLGMNQFVRGGSDGDGSAPACR